MVRLLDYVVREDWREVTREMRRRRIVLWRRFVGLVLVSALAILVLEHLLPESRWRNAARTAVYSAPFIAFSLGEITRWRAGSALRSALAYVAVSGTATLAHLARPPLETEAGALWPGLSLLAGAAVLTSWAFLLWERDENRDEMLRLGLIARGWIPNAALGLLIGATLAVHLCLIRHFAGFKRAGGVSLTLVLWTLCFSLGVKGLGGELLFRGLGYQLLRERMGRPLWGTVAVLTLLSLLPQIALRSMTFSGTLDAWVLPYLALLASTNTVLRGWRESLVPGVASQVAFTVGVLLLTGHAI